MKTTDINTQIFGLKPKQKSIEADLTELYFNKPGASSPEELSFYRNLSEDLGLPLQTDLVVCNPPWIPASFVRETNPLDNGVYDPDEKFLTSAFNYCRLHLSQQGEMLLIYSDLAWQLGL